MICKSFLTYIQFNCPTSMISKNYSKCGLIRPQHTFPPCVSPSQISSGPEKLATFLGVVDIELLLFMVEL